MTQRIEGKLVKWRGPFGWIVPSQPIKHPMAKKHGGKVYLDQIDVDQEISGVGAMVSFFVYSDGAGLGACHCIPAKGNVAVQKTIQKPKAKTAALGGRLGGAAAAPSSGRLQAKEAGGAAGKAAKGKGKGKGKGQAPAEDGEKKAQTPPDKTKRETLSEGPLNGTVMDWRGEVGWIKPDEPIEFPDTATKKRHKGKLYCHATDVDSELPLIGATVLYWMYSDEHGLGAEMVQVIEQGDGVKKPKTTAADGADAAAEEDDGLIVEEDADSMPVKQAHQRTAGLLQRSKFVAKAKAKVSANEALAKGKGKGKDKGKGKGKGKGKATNDEDKGPSGPDLPRERVVEEPVLGEVVTWKGKFGWIKPLEEIDHPEASKHGGKIYCHRKDLIGAETLEKGDTVQFNVFKDASGLGAEEVVPC